MELKVSCHFIDNLQPTNSNVKLLQYHGIFLTPFNLICTKVRNTPQPCDDPAYQRTLQETLHTPSTRWGRDRSIFSTPTQMKYHSLFGIALWWKSHHTGNSLSICFTNQFTGSYITQVPTGSYVRTYFSVGIIKTSPRHPNFQKPSISWPSPSLK